MSEHHEHDGHHHIHYFGTFYLYMLPEERELLHEDDYIDWWELTVAFLAVPEKPLQDHRVGEFYPNQGHYCPECDIWWACPSDAVRGNGCRAPLVVTCGAMCFPIKCEL